MIFVIKYVPRSCVSWKKEWTLPLVFNTHLNMHNVLTIGNILTSRISRWRIWTRWVRKRESSVNLPLGWTLIRLAKLNMVTLWLWSKRVTRLCTRITWPCLICRRLHYKVLKFRYSLSKWLILWKELWMQIPRLKWRICTSRQSRKMQQVSLKISTKMLTKTWWLLCSRFIVITWQPNGILKWLTWSTRNTKVITRNSLKNCLTNLFSRMRLVWTRSLKNRIWRNWIKIWVISRERACSRFTRN